MWSHPLLSRKDQVSSAIVEEEVKPDRSESEPAGEVGGMAGPEVSEAASLLTK
jgi:hypothetical protein